MKGLSRDICNSDIVLLTGAGASAPLGLRLMTSFMDLLEEEVRDRSPKLMALLRGIYTDKHSKNERARRDLELLLERLEEYDKFNELVQKDVNLQQRFQGIGVYQEFASLANELDKLTRDLIFKHYSEIDNKEVSRLYTDFLNILVNNNGGRFLPIFTTNYDRVIERFVMTNSTKWSLVDGFANLPGHGDCWNEQVYHTYISNTRHDNRKDIVLFKLHGSIFWYKRKGEDEIFRMPHSSRRDITLENVLLYPAQTKNTLIEPFKTCYDYLGECLANCKVCVVVGHSFRDPYILEKLKYAANKNGRFALLVIDPGNVEGKVLSIGKHCKWVPHKVGFGNIKIGNTLVEFERGLRSLLS